MLKIDSCLIIRDEKENIESLLKQLLEFSNNIYIADTGSIDGTIDIIKKLAEEHNNIHLDHFDWIDDFGAARNYAFSLTKDSDYIFWCDGDDFINKELIDKLNQFKSENETTEGLADIYFIQLLLQDGVFLDKKALLKTSRNYKWTFRIHEVIINQQNEVINVKYFDKDKNEYIKHLSSESKRKDEQGTYKDRNLNIFKSQDANKDYFCGFNIFNYANELYQHKQYLLSYLAFSQLFSNRDGTLGPGHLLHAYCLMYSIYFSNENTMKNLDPNLVKIGEDLYNKGYKSRLMMSQFAYISMKYDKIDNAIRLYEEIFNNEKNNINFPHKAILVNEENYINTINDYINVVHCYDIKKDYDMAKKYNNLILEKDPENTIALNNKKYLEGLIY